MEEQTSASSNLVETGGVALLTYTLCSDKKLLKTLTGEDQPPRTRFSLKIVQWLENSTINIPVTKFSGAHVCRIIFKDWKIFLLESSCFYDLGAHAKCCWPMTTPSVVLVARGPRTRFRGLWEEDSGDYDIGKIKHWPPLFVPAVKGSMHSAWTKFVYPSDKKINTWKMIDTSQVVMIILH